MPSPTPLRRLAAPVLALGLLAGACSDGDDDALGAEACDAYATLSASFMGDPAAIPDAVADLEAAVPERLRDDVAAYGDALQASFGGDEGALGDAAFQDASAALGDAVYDGCEAEAQLDVTGVDFGFDGLPAELAAGRTALRFTNGTEAGEAHELVLMRKADGTTESLDELLALPEEEAMAKLAPVGVVFSDQAGGTATTLLDLDAGEYVAVCFIPVGGDGPPHFVEGMAAELTVA